MVLNGAVAQVQTGFEKIIYGGWVALPMQDVYGLIQQLALEW
jgi:hypothetical protein